MLLLLVEGIALAQFPVQHACLMLHAFMKGFDITQCDTLTILLAAVPVATAAAAAASGPAAPAGGFLAAAATRTNRSSSSMKGFLDHVIEATLPVLKICLLGSVGAILARAVRVADSSLIPPKHCSRLLPTTLL